MTYPECLRYLAALGHELHGMTFGLEAISKILLELDRPHEHYDSVMVAGTNGKGSACAMLAAIMEHAGYRTGLFTSPHLLRVNERMRVNGQDISDQDFAAAFSAVVTVVERLIARQTLAQPPSFFEFLTATAFLHFAQAEVQFAVLEVGMGGRLDATNIADARLAVITNIDFDHMEFLGSTLPAIAAEKAGIIKMHRPVISGVEDAEAAAVIRRRAEEFGSELLELSKVAQLANLRANQGRYSFDLKLGHDHFTGLTCPLLGAFQVKNTVAAVAAAWRLEAEGFSVSRRSVLQGLNCARWPGRLEAISSQPLVLLDGGHNPGAARELAEFISKELAGHRVRLVYASMRDKDIRRICHLLFPLVEEVYLTQPQHERAATPDEILAALDFHSASLHIEPEPCRALEQAYRASSARDVVLVVGSLFLVAAIKQAQNEGKLHW